MLLDETLLRICGLASVSFVALPPLFLCLLCSAMGVDSSNIGCPWLTAEAAGYLSGMSRFPPDGAGIEMGLYQRRVEKDTPANFAERDCAITLLISNPPKAGAAGFVKKNFK
jgi:hypothetical protein